MQQQRAQSRVWDTDQRFALPDARSSFDHARREPQAITGHMVDPVGRYREPDVAARLS